MSTTRDEALRLVGEGRTQREAAEIVGVSRPLVARWCSDAGVRRPKSPLYIGWVADRLPRPDLPEGCVLRPAELELAEARWKTRVRAASVEEVLDRALRSSWGSDATVA